jgi:hypothetical protein
MNGIVLAANNPIQSVSTSPNVSALSAPGSAAPLFDISIPVTDRSTGNGPTIHDLDTVTASTVAGCQPLVWIITGQTLRIRGARDETD